MLGFDGQVGEGAAWLSDSTEFAQVNLRFCWHFLSLVRLGGRSLYGTFAIRVKGWVVGIGDVLRPLLV